ncbi:MAG: hypothetical protein AB1728_01055 [Bacteroidota bacterium]
MKKIYIASLLLFSMESFSQHKESFETNSQHILGVGINSASYTTTWYYYYWDGYNPAEYNYPLHQFDRMLITAFYERRSILSWGVMHVGFHAELQFGINGGTNEDWLPRNETISDGGGTFGFSALLKFTYPLHKSASVNVGGFLGTGFQFTTITSNGQGISRGGYANWSEYKYASGWTETIFSIPLTFGINLDVTSFVIIPEYRLLLTGGASTDWDPRGSEVEDEGPDYSMLLINVGIRL